MEFVEDSSSHSEASLPGSDTGSEEQDEGEDSKQAENPEPMLETELKEAELQEVEPQAEEEKKEVDNQEKVQGGVYLDREWLSILKATHEMIPLENKRYDLTEFIHPLQIGHQDLIIK